MPRAADVRVSLPLTSWARDAKWNERLPWLLPVIAPYEDVASQKGTYKYYGTEMLLDDVDDTKAEKGETNEIGYNIDETDYATIERGFKVFVSYKEIQQWKHPETAKKRAVRFLQNRLLLRAERRMVSSASGTSNTTTPSYDWDHADATPVDDIAAAKAAFKTACGLPATDIVVPEHVMEELAVADQIQSLAKYQQFFNMLKITGANFAAQSPFGLRWHVADKMYISSTRGATETKAAVWGDDAYLFRVSNDELDAPWAKTFRFSKWLVFEWEDKDRGGFYVKITSDYITKVVNTNAVHKMVDVT